MSHRLHSNTACK